MRVLAALPLLVFACGGDDGPPPVFPADYAATYQEVRNCRLSIDHDFDYIRVLADPAALGPYQDRTTAFPTGAIVLKEQYGMDDATCTGPIVAFTAMVRLDQDSSPDTLDWDWQRVTPARKVENTDLMKCIACHTGCGMAPQGYQGTCAMP